MGLLRKLFDRRKKFTVSRYRDWGGIPMPSTYRERHFRWRWQADAYAGAMCRLFGYNCEMRKRWREGWHEQVSG